MLFPGWTGSCRADDAVENALSGGQKALEDGDTLQALGHLLQAVRLQQDLIRRLEQAAAGQLDTIHRQEETLVNLNQRLSEQEAVIEEQRATISGYEEKLKAYESGPMTPIAAVEEVRQIEDLYQRAYLTRRTGIFDVRRRDADPYFQKSVEQFRYIAETYPESKRAPDAQLQAAKTYHRWLNDTGQAIREYRLLIERWPESPFAAEAREALSELGQNVSP